MNAPANSPIITSGSEFKNRIKLLINEYAVGDKSNTPDWILEDYLTACLSAFDEATIQRDKVMAARGLLRIDKGAIP